ncbi:hypothetical protein KFL_000580330 [Klebsormidium nitens]|uniref:C3H1-type domain-containing protein n=1 Tax=Klebsormidium nitens TaxID=105231 RepID=A0A1Y1HXQ1_KLENI|nr:hypothetical protein KFL_000580330 [Klebsormidium nitens]|eukprot:GAQ80638.1 hypothetical protein KFL_000580330 [Klebsormidium nitens]
MSPLKASPMRSRFGRSASLPSTILFSDSAPPKEERLKPSPSADWEEAARDQLEIQALASSMLQAAATGCFYITPAPVIFKSPLPSDGQSPPSPDSPLPPYWNRGVNGYADSSDRGGGASPPAQVPKDELVPGGQYGVTWWDSRNAEALVRGRVEKFLCLDPLLLANQLRELSSSEPAFIEGGPHHLTNLVDVFWSMACNSGGRGTVLPPPDGGGYCGVCFAEMGRSSCYNPFHARGVPDWWREMQEYWDESLEKAREDGRDVDCMFFCGKMGCLNPVACTFRHDEQARRKICQETGRIRRRATFGSSWMADLGLPGMF